MIQTVESRECEDVNCNEPATAGGYCAACYLNSKGVDMRKLGLTKEPSNGRD